MEANEKLTLQIKLKPNQRLSCASCALFFEDVLSAAEHIVNCKVMPLDSRKRRESQWTEYAKRRALNKCGIPPKRRCQEAPLISSKWNKQVVAKFLKIVAKYLATLGDARSDQSKIWADISSELIDDFPWALQSVCRIKWRKLNDEVTAYDTDAMNHTIEKPPFYYVVREFEKRIQNNSERSKKTRIFSSIASLELNSVKDEMEESSSIEDDLADPDAVEEEPFSGVLDSQGNTIMRELLLDIVQSIESFDFSLPQIAEKHGVEEAIVEWVKTNQDAVIKGCLRCSTCDLRILKRKEYLQHILDCAESTPNFHEMVPQTSSLSLQKKDAEFDEWSPSVIAKMIRIFSRACRSYISPQGILRSGVWMEVYTGLKRKINGLTPKMCSLKWRKLILQSQDYHLKMKECYNSGITLEEPPFYKAISTIMDLSEVKAHSDEFLTPCTSFLDSKEIFNDHTGDSDEDLMVAPNDVEDVGQMHLQDSGEFKRKSFSIDVNLEDEDTFEDEDFSDFDQDLEDLDEENGSGSIISPLIEFDVSEEDLEQKKSFSLPDSLEPSIHLLSSKEELPHQEETKIKNNQAPVKDIERKTNIILSRLSHLEEETQAMKFILDSKDTSDNNLDEKINRLQQNVTQNHTQTLELLENMGNMFERHHKESLDALNKLTNAILTAKKSE